MKDIEITITPKAIRDPHIGFPTRTCFASNIRYSDGSRSYGQIDMTQVRALFIRIIEELADLAKQAEEEE